jgi:hypothetical protein
VHLWSRCCAKDWSRKGMKLSFNVSISREILQSQQMTRGLAPFSGKYDDKKQISAVP